MAEPANLKVLREAVLEMAGRGIRAERQGKRLPSVTLDVDSAPIEVHGHQPKAEWREKFKGGSKMAFVTDPDGYEVELLETK